MLSSTASDATQRVLLDERLLAGMPALGEIAARALNAGLCSPAGLHRRPWLARLRRALERELFVLHFQPIVRVGDRAVSHHEALLRLADEPDGRLVAPGRFLPAAERYGLIREIDLMVIELVARLLGEHHDQASRVAVNVSALSVTDPATLEHIARRLGCHAWTPRPRWTGPPR